MKNKITVKKCLILIVINCFTLLTKAQAFKPGDIIISANYGAPQITPLILKAALTLYNKSKHNDDYTFSIKNSGVFNAKAEYAVMENLGLGFASSYWTMGVEMKNNYMDNDPVTGASGPYADKYNLTISAFAIGIRGNYHIIEEDKLKKVDPYFGLTLGTTKYTYGLAYESTYPDRKAPDTYEFFKTGYASKLLRAGWSSYFSTTFGVRLYPVKYLGFNFEAGWDRGAFLFGGVAFKFHTKEIKAFND